MKRGGLRRRGAVLVLVLVVVPVLALGAYSFTHWMRAEATASIVATRQAQARWLAQSGLAWFQAVLSEQADPNVEPMELEDNPFDLAGQQLLVEESGLTGMFSIVTPLPVEVGEGIRYGVGYESAKIPLHNQGLNMTEDSLMGLPGMTEEIAAALLDWIDADDEVRELGGAERDYYLGLSQPYQPRNGVPQSIGELLMVKGVTPYLLYGEDANLDGLLNPNENDGNENWPPDNADGILDRGWFPYLTMFSKSVEINPEGEPKININGEISDDDQATLSEMFGEEFVTFLNAYKQENDNITALSSLIDARVEIRPGGRGSGQSGGNQQQGGQQGGQSQRISAVPQQISPPDGPQGGQQRGGGGRGGNQGGGGSRGGNQRGGGDEEEVQILQSPWRSANAGEYLNNAMQYLTVSEEPVRNGLIDVGRAQAAVIRALPQVTEELADGIASAALERDIPDDDTPAWLLVDQVVTLEEFRRLEPHITSSSAVYRVEVVGFFAPQGPMSRLEAIIDSSETPPLILRRRDLTPLGNGYPVNWLVNEGG